MLASNNPACTSTQPSNPLPSEYDALRLRAVDDLTIALLAATSNPELLQAAADMVEQPELARLLKAIAAPESREEDALRTVLVRAIQRYRVGVEGDIAGQLARLSSAGDFLDARCVSDSDRAAITTDLFRAYETWCENESRLPANKKRFHVEVRRRGFVMIEVEPGHFGWLGLGVAEPEAVLAAE